MRTILRACAMVLLLISVGYSSPSTEVRNVGLLQLISTPEKFDGQVIAVVGFLEMSRDGDLLYLHQEDSANWILANSVWIRRTEQMGKDRKLLHRKYVKVIGTFKLGYHEQLGNPPNGFADVQNVRIWSDPNDPVGRKNIPGTSQGPE